MNFNWVPFSDQIATILHAIIPKTLVLPILQGPIRGEKWVVTSGVLEYFLGCFEPDKVRLFELYIKKGKVVYDIGAHVGYFSLLAAILVQDEGQVIAFEPNPDNVRHLRQHIEMNGYSNIKVIETAVSNENGEASFDNEKENSKSRLSPTGKIKVKTLTIDTLVESKEIPPPNYMKIDVEGAEVLVIKGAESTIKSYRPHIFLATHSPVLKNDCLDILDSLGYIVKPESGDDLDEAKELFAQPTIL